MHRVDASQTPRQTGVNIFYFLTWSAQTVSLNKCEICLIVSLLNDIKGSTTNGAVTLCIRVVVIALHINSYVPRLKPDNVSNDDVWSTTVPSAPGVYWYEQCLCSDTPIRDKNSRTSSFVGIPRRSLSKSFTVL